VDKYGPRVFENFEKTRIVTPANYYQELRLDELMNNAFCGLQEIVSPRKIVK
jgi:hypothetical protein